MSNLPSKFLETLGSGKHVVLFYENPDYGQTLQFGFIKNGLLKGEHCIYTITHRDDVKLVENEMTRNGIDVETFRKRKLLHIYQITNPIENPDDALKERERIINRITTDSKPPFNIASKLLPEIRTEKQLKAYLSMERACQSTFPGFPGPILCSYRTEEAVEPTILWKLMEGLVQNHHAVIFAPRYGEGIAVNLR